MTRRRWFRALPAVVALVAACGADAPTWQAAAVPTITTATTAAPTTTRPAARATTTTRARRPAVHPLTRVKGAQAIVVTAADYGATTATFTTYSRGPRGWTVVHGPWRAFVGREGVAPPGAKREGDGRTPSGTYGFDFFFGVRPDPGVKFPYRQVTGPNIVWVEDPANPHYNQWVDRDEVDVGDDPDNMYKPPYDYGAVVSYNTAARTPGLGSGIFIHISIGRPSAGCITLPVDQVLSVLRWLDPAASPAIVIGVGG